MLLKLQFYSVFLPSIPWLVFEYHMLGTELTPLFFPLVTIIIFLILDFLIEVTLVYNIT